jgi:hypothetical protein
MDLWQLLLLGVVRLALDCDYDRLEEVANYVTLGQGDDGPLRFSRPARFQHKTISANVCHADGDLSWRRSAGSW